jgi:uncharacterized protein YdeI (YjbR/CyaY-like superfamily)
MPSPGARGSTATTGSQPGCGLSSRKSYSWIDGQLRKSTDTTYCRRFTPRRAGSAWSKRNVGIVEQLVAEGRMHTAGQAEVERAKADGRWDVAYAGSTSIEVPADFATALTSEPRAQAMFEVLTSQNRYSAVYRIGNARRADTRAKRIEQFVAMHAREETMYPQKGIHPSRRPRGVGRRHEVDRLVSQLFKIT